MNTIPTALVIIGGVSALLLMAAVTILWTLEPDEDYPVEQYGKTGLSNRGRIAVVVVVWLAPTAAAVAGWAVWG